MKTKNITFNFIMNIMLTMSVFLFHLVTFPYASRVLGPEGIGRVSFSQSVISYFLLFSGLGIPSYGVRACAKVRDDREELSKVVQELLLINIAMVLLAYLVLLILLFTVPRFESERTLLLISSIVMPLNALGMSWLYQGLEDYRYITTRSVLCKSLSVLFIFALVRSKANYVQYAFLMVAANYAYNVFCLFHSHKLVNFWKFPKYDFRRHFKAVGIFFAMSCATTIYTNLDTVMLGFLTNDAEVGYYNVGVKIKVILVSLITSLGTVLLPRFTYYLEKNEKGKYLESLKQMTNFVMLISLPISIYFILFSYAGIMLISGSSYEAAVIPMQIIMPTVLLIGLSNVTGIQILVPIGKEKAVLYSEIGGAIVDLILNWILIPRFGASGAAVGTLFAEATVLFIQFIFLRGNSVLDAFREIQYGKIIVALILSCLGVSWIRRDMFSSFVTLAVSSVIFFGIYLIILLLLREKWVNANIKKYMRRRDG